MPIRSLRELMLLLCLYERENVSVQDIAGMIGAHENNVRPLKRRFVAAGFLEENGSIERRGGFLKIYRINHKRIDDFCVKETPLHFFYKRARDRMSILQDRNSDQEKIRSWLQPRMSISGKSP